VKKHEIEEMEKRDAVGYARIPSQPDEFAEWESEQVWPEEESSEQEEAIQQSAAMGGGAARMEKALEQAAEIRHKLKGRHHSDGSEETWKDFDEILRAALSLPPALREMLADHLLASLDSPNQKKIEAAWAEEIERRIREIDEGKVETIDGEVVMQKLRSRLRRQN
jgi:putative addiction module component (TIGR02574 family)